MVVLYTRYSQCESTGKDKYMHLPGNISFDIKHSCSLGWWPLTEWQQGTFSAYGREIQCTQPCSPSKMYQQLNVINTIKQYIYKTCHTHLCIKSFTKFTVNKVLRGDNIQQDFSTKLHTKHVKQTYL